MIKKRYAHALKHLASIILPWFDTLVVQFKKKTENHQMVLIVRLDAIGDFVLWLDTAQKLFQYYKKQGKTVVLLGNKAWANWANELAIADEVWSLEPAKFMKNPRYRANWVRRIRGAGFGTVVHPTFSRELLTGDSIVRTSGAKYRIGSEGDCTNTPPWLKHWTDHWYTQLVNAVAMPQMELRHHAEFMQGLTGSKHPAVIPQLLPDSKIDRSIFPTQPYAVLFPSASWSGRVWPASRFVEIGRRLIATGRQVVLAGGPGDAEFTNPVAEGLEGTALNLVGKTSLPQLSELLRLADLTITNETSAVHIGAAVQARLLCILGGGHYGRFAPYDVDVLAEGQKLPRTVSQKMDCFGCNWRCIYACATDAPVRCIDNIGVEQVWAQAIELLHEPHAQN